jgi:hypothetical protein
MSFLDEESSDLGIDPEMMQALELISSGGGYSTPSLADYSSAGIDDASIQSAYGNVGMSPSQKLASMLTQLVPLGIAALSGGGSERYENASKAGVLSGENAMKAFEEESKQKRVIDQLGLKQRFELAKQTARDKSLTDRTIQTKKLTAEAQAAKTKDDREWDKTKMGMQFENDKKLAAFRESIDKKDPKETLQAWEIENLNQRAKDLYGDKFTPLPPGATADQGQRFITSQLKEGRVATMADEKEQRTRQGLTAEGLAFRRNPEMDLNGDKPTPAQVKDSTEAMRTIPGLVRATSRLKALYDPSDPKLKDVGIFGSAAKGEVINERKQVINDLINQVKTLQGMGANFTIMESGIVQGQMGVSPPEPTFEAVDKYFRQQELQGANFGKNIERFQNEIIRKAFDRVGANGFVLNESELQETERGKVILQQLQTFDAGTGSAPRCLPAPSAEAVMRDGRA